jgi:hypothetical protein
VNIGRDHLGEPPLQVADAAADFDAEASAADRGNAIVEILVDEAQDRLAIPDAAMVRELPPSPSHRLDAHEREQHHA